MAGDERGDHDLRGANRAEPLAARYPSWTMPVVVALIGATAILVNGWFAYVASTSKELVEANSRTIQVQHDNLKERVDRIDERLTHMERE